MILVIFIACIAASRQGSNEEFRPVRRHMKSKPHLALIDDGRVTHPHLKRARKPKEVEKTLEQVGERPSDLIPADVGIVVYLTQGGGE